MPSSAHRRRIASIALLAAAMATRKLVPTDMFLVAWNHDHLTYSLG